MKGAPADPLRWGNVPVPYTAIWSGELERRQPHVRWETWNGKRMGMLCDGVDDPTGKPVFKILHGERTRRVVREELCQMCVRPMPRDLVGFNSGECLGIRPLLRDGLPMCPGCALAAFEACPGLRRQADGRTLRVYAVRRGAWEYAPVINGYALPEDGGSAEVNELAATTPGGLWSGPDLLLTEWKRISVMDLRVAAMKKR